MSKLDQVLARIDADLDASLARLFKFLSIKSISTDPAYAEDCRAAAVHLATDISTLDIAAEVIRPTVVWSSPKARQPVEIAAVWCSTATTMCSRSTRSICGKRRPSSRGSRCFPTAARRSSRAAPATTKAR